MGTGSRDNRVEIEKGKEGQSDDTGITSGLYIQGVSFSWG